MKYSYTYGDPNNIDGHIGSGWSATEISHNSKEILDIKYVDEEYLKNKEYKDNMMRDIFDNIKDNKDIINAVRKSNNLEPIFND